MRAAPRTPPEGAGTSFAPTKEQMWSLWAGECMDHRCRRDAEVWVTTQMTWRSATALWTFCEEHAQARLRFFLAARLYFLQIESAGTIQQELPLEG